MSYDLCKYISARPEKNQIILTVANNNIRPLYYTQWEYKLSEKSNYDKKLLYLMGDFLDGNIQISQLNKTTIPFKYAILKIQEYYKKNNIDHYKDKYEKKYELYKIKLSKYADTEDWHKQVQFEKENKELVDGIINNIYKELYGTEFEIFKNAINEKIEGKYYIKDDFGHAIYIVSKSKYGYKYSQYSEPIEECLTDYKLAYIQSKMLGYEFSPCKYEEKIKNIEDEEEEYE